VYLPKRWVSMKGLGPGAQVCITETESSLVISAVSPTVSTARVHIVPENRADLRNILTHLYRRGIEFVDITGVDLSSRKELTCIASDLIGFEMTVCEGDFCRLENLSVHSETKYPVILRRLFFINKEVLRMLSEELTTGLYGQDITGLRTQIDRYVLFCRRSLLREPASHAVSLQWELLTFLMHINHSMIHIHDYASQCSFRATPLVRDLLIDAENLFRLYCDAFFCRSMESIHMINAMKHELVFQKCFNYCIQAVGEERVVVSLLRDTLRLIQIGTSPILSELLQEKCL
jgi:phosphate uptake regulator